MFKFRKVVTLFLTLSMLLFNATSVLAVPPLPSSLYGTVKINGENVPTDTVVSAWIDGVQYSYDYDGLIIYQGDTTFALDVPGDDPSTLDIIEGGVTNSTIVLHIGDLVATPTINWISGTNRRVNISAHVNRAPVITEGETVGVSMSEDGTPTAFGLTLHATDLDADSLTWSVITPPEHGAASAAGTGLEQVVSYTPLANSDLSDSFVVQVSDGNGGTDSITVNVSISAINDAPVITAQQPLSTAEETPLEITIASLIITDPDSTVFTLSVEDGANYTRTGNTITPALNFTGTLHVPVTVSDAEAASAEFDLQVTVNNINDAPVITAQQPLSTAEETPLEITIASLIISDPDSSAFTLSVGDGANYTRTGNTITPALNFTGTLHVPVTVSDNAGAASAQFDLQVTVDNLNDAPVITGQAAPISIIEDTSREILLSYVTVVDVDSAILTLSVQNGTGYSHTGNTITPALNVTAPLTVNVTVSDGQASSAPFGLAVTVTPVNDPPVITAQYPVATAEETARLLSLTDLQISDPDSTVFTLSVGDGANYTRTGNTITPVLDFIDTLHVPVTVRDDGGAASAEFDLQVTVNNLNDAPVITGQAAPISINEDTSRVMQLADVNVTDVDSSTLSLVVQDDPDYTRTGNTITPLANSHGTLGVWVRVSDGSALSAPFELTVTVNPLNDPPVITAQSAVSTPEETAVTISLSHVTVSDPDSSAFTLSAEDGANYTRTGNTITPALNFTGTLHVLVRVRDYDGAASAPFDLQVTVDNLNDAPVITGQAAPISIIEDTSREILLSDVTVVDVDSATLTLSVQNGTGYSHTGNTITPALNVTDQLTVNVTVLDDVGAASAPFGLAVTVTPVNDPPVITAQTGPLATAEDTPLAISLANVSVTDVDSSAFTLTVQPGTNYTRSGNTITPAANFNGTLTVNVTVSDNEASSAPFGLAVTVTPVNDAPVITQGDTILVSMSEDGSPTPFELTLNATDADADAITWSISRQAEHGAASASGPGASKAISYTPISGFVGSDSFVVQVSDGHDGVDSITVNVNVQWVNASPVITEGVSVSLIMSEDGAPTPFALTLHATDADGDDLTWSVSTPASLGTASASGNGPSQLVSYTPNANIFGNDSFVVQVSDGNDGVDTITINVSIQAVNDPPVITGQEALSTPEETPLTITLAHLTIFDPDSDTFTLTVVDGDNYSTIGNTITPAVDFNDTLVVQVRVSDGQANSPDYNLIVTVTPLNDAPVITAQDELTTPEETALTISLDDVTVFDPDSIPADLALVVGNGSNYSHNGNTITPAVNFNGTLSVQVTVSDGSASGPTYALLVDVSPVNDTPVITGQVALSTPEETPLTITLAHLTIFDPDSNTFTLTVVDGDNYSTNGNTITPEADFTNTLTVPVTVSDGSAVSGFFNLSVSVGGVDDTPVITGQHPLSTPEETAITLSVDDLIILDPDSSSFTLHVQDGTNYTRSGNTITPALNFDEELTVPVTVSDGHSTSAAFQLVVDVTPVNDVPVITGQTSLSTAEETALTILVSNLTISDPDDSGFTLAVRDGSNYTRSGNTITPALNFTGTLAVPVTVSDGEAVSLVYTLSVAVNTVNDAPVIDQGSSMSMIISEDSNPTAFSLTLSAVDVDNATLTWSISRQAQHGAASASGTGASKAISYTPQANYHGTDSFIVQVADGQDGVDTITINLTVQPVNDAPVISEGAAVTVNMSRNGMPVAFNLTLHVTDLEGGALTWSLVDQADHGTAAASGTGAALVVGYTPQDDFVGADSFEVQVSDSSGAVDTITVHVNVSETLIIHMYLPLVTGRR